MITGKRLLYAVWVLSLAVVAGCPLGGDRDGDGFEDTAESSVSRTATDPGDPSDNPITPRNSDGDACTDYSETQFGLCDGNANSPPLTVNIEGPSTYAAGARMEFTALVSGGTISTTLDWSGTGGIELVSTSGSTAEFDFSTASSTTIRVTVSDPITGFSASSTTTLALVSELRFDSLPDTPANFGEFVTRAKWQKGDLTYFVVNTSPDLPADRQRQILADAFSKWAAVTNLTFQEVGQPSSADIVIGFGVNQHCELYQSAGTQCNSNAAFSGTVLAHCYYPPPAGGPSPGDCHFNDSFRFTESIGTNDPLLLEVAIHELGHGLGLDHNPTDRTSIMFPSADPTNVKTELGPDDIAGIQSLYGSRSGTPPQPPTEPPATPPNPPSPPNGPQPGDSDGDGIDDQTELFVFGTNPNNPDTDGDTLSDGYEVSARLNPLNPDTDGDGVSDGQEIANGTDPYRPDVGGGGGPGLAGNFAGQDSAGSAFQFGVDSFGQARGILSIRQFGFAADVPFFGSVNSTGQIQLVSFDYYFAFFGQISGNAANGQFQTAAGGFGTWGANRVSGIPKVRDGLPRADSAVYQPVPSEAEPPTHPALQRVHWSRD